MMKHYINSYARTLPVMRIDRPMCKKYSDLKGHDLISSDEIAVLLLRCFCHPAHNSVQTEVPNEKSIGNLSVFFKVKFHSIKY